MVNIFRAHYNLEKFKRDPQRLNPNKRTNRDVLTFNPAGVSSLADWRSGSAAFAECCCPPAYMNNCFVYQNVASIFCARKRVLLYDRTIICYIQLSILYN
uniref:Uncharacterized protein n=1 Tax=Trichogramma kaykai TaxID=54128 RepID=A0ABD2XEI3_9HYME